MEGQGERVDRSGGPGRLTRLARSPRTAQVLGWVALAVLLVFFVQMFGKANRSGGYDFTSYLLSAEALLAGGNPYDTGSPFAYVYPMWPAFALIPLTFLPYWLANAVWFVLGAAALVGALRGILEMAFPGRVARGGAADSIPLLLCLFLSLNVLQNNFLNGQINFLVLWCCVQFLRKMRVGRDGPAGMFLAMAVATKIVPALLLVPIVAAQRWRLLLVAIGGTVGLCVLPLLLPGQSGVELYQEYASRYLVGPLTGEGAWSGDRVHFSIVGALREYGPGAAIPRGVQLGIAAALVVGLGALGIAGRKRRGDASLAWTFTATLLCILLLSPKSETHHLVFLVPGALLVTGSVFWGPKSRARTIGWAAFLACFLLGSQLRETPLLFLSILGLLALVAREAIAPRTNVSAGRALPAH